MFNASAIKANRFLAVHRGGYAQGNHGGAPHRPGEGTLIEGSHRALLHGDSSAGQRRLTVVARSQALQKNRRKFRPPVRARTISSVRTM